LKLFSRKYGTGFPIVILHGLYGSSDNWLTIGKTLSEKYSVYLIDQRNHGKSEHSNIHNYDAMSDDLFEFFNENKIEKAIVIGHSMGGKTAMFFAEKFPEMVKKLIVVDIAPFTYSAKFATSHEHILNSLSKLNLEICETRIEIENQLSEYIEEESLRKFLLKNIGRNADNSFYWIMNLSVLKNSLPDILQGLETQNKINVPTLFIKGEKSHHIEMSDFEKIKSIFTNAKFEIIKNAGHWLHAEQPEAFLNRLNTYIENEK